jgi:lysozyme
MLGAGSPQTRETITMMPFTTVNYPIGDGLVARTFSPAAGVASAQLIDVSNFQGNFNWKSAKAAVPGLWGGIYRLTQGLPSTHANSPDPFAGWNHQQIRDNGLHPGSYHFLDPALPGKDQAAYYVDEQDKLGWTKSTIAVVDNETHGRSGSQVAACAAAFMQELLVLRPHTPHLVYTYINFAQTGNDAGLGSYPLWLAWPSSSAPSAPPPWTKWTIWQWGTRFAGGQTVDADAFNGTTADADTWLASFDVPSSLYVSDGTEDWSQIAAKVGRTSAGLARRTATHFGAYDAGTSAYIETVLGGSVLLVPKGANLWAGN